MLVFNIDMNQIIASPKYIMILTIFSKALQILIVAALFKFKFSIKKFKIFNDNYSIYSNFIFSIGVLGIITIWLSIGFKDFSNKSVYNVLLLFLYAAFLILLARDLSERNRLIKIKNKYQIQEYQINNMEQIIAIIKKEKHDYAEHIEEIQALCDLNEPDSLETMKEYISEITNSIHDSFKFLNTGNDYIDGLLSIKSNYAQKNNIEFNVVINDMLDILKIKSEEIISIISNLIDNSFEAFDETMINKSKSVYFETCLRDNKFIIEIGNNGKEIPKDIIENIFAKGFTTKGDKNSDHGYGLFITKELVEKNNGTIRVESDEFETAFTIIFDLE
ncbi:MAG: sensor histidine kinase [Solirubrobacterales bacterium]